MENFNCDGAGPHVAGEVKMMPHGTDANHGNSILCRACWDRELNYRRMRNREFCGADFELPAWSTAKVYGE